MARTGDGRLALVELKAVDAAYPMLGELALEPKMPIARTAGRARRRVFGAAVDSTLLARLDLKIGDRVTVGNATFQIRSVVNAEPDKLAGGVGLGPRFLVSEAGLRATELAAAGQPGALDLPGQAAGDAADDRAATALVDDAARARCLTPAGRSAAAAMPRRSSSAPSTASPNS